MAAVCRGFDYDQIDNEVFIGSNMCCQLGFDRASTLFVAYLVKNGMQIDDATKYLKSKRPTIHLRPAQLEGLKLFKNPLNH